MKLSDQLPDTSGHGLRSSKWRTGLSMPAEDSSAQDVTAPEQHSSTNRLASFSLVAAAVSANGP